MKTWFITGANRGFGLEIARTALQAGDRVTATARHPDTMAETLAGHGERLYTLPLDVTDPSAVDRAVHQAADRHGHIDVLVNNAGYGQLGAFEEVARDDLMQQFATNVHGVFDVTRAVLPLMRARRQGHVITISSIAGIEGYAGSSVYCATKHAVSGWSEGLAQEVAPFGIKVTCVYPGRFRTDFLDHSSVRYGDRPIDDYAATSAQHRQALDENNHLQAGDPVKLAHAILTLAASDQPPLWFAAGSEAYGVFVRKAEALRHNAEEWRDLTESLDIEA
ncbi:oxidoreductase [Chromohalobacter israelensis]|uniref:oxidoreductase n=1 Tax=Chromohalobacter israelensis TaxID=141390 RepID=UPI00265C8A58|nr:oxidoreductase [Chromohalobacter salexigens]MDO0944197.1 oxidoreductase [Chromohalobacter salexigens]